MSRANRTGRSKGSGRFLALHHFMLDSPAWASLSPQERAVYLALAQLYDGKNNGFLGLGVRRAGELANVHKDTAGRCLIVLTERGFIECTTPGSFNTNGRRATEWRLTAYNCDRSHQPASKAFLRWRPNSRCTSENPGANVLKQGTQSRDEPACVPPIRTGTR